MVWPSNVNDRKSGSRSRISRRRDTIGTSRARYPSNRSYHSRSQCVCGITKARQRRRRVPDGGLGRRKRARRVREGIERTRPPHDELRDLRERPCGEHREHDGAGRGDPSTVQPAGAQKKERKDPPEEAVPVQIREGNGDDRGHEIPLRGDREVELRVEVAERGEELVQRERRWRQTKNPMP